MENDYEYNEDELVAPEWINRHLLEQIFKEIYENEPIEIEGMKLSRAGEKGGHYASIISRLSIEYRRGAQPRVSSVSMIIKVMPEMDGAQKDMLLKSKLFETEISIYSNVIPRFENILRKYGDETTFGPRLFHHSLEAHKFLLLEDLMPLGYDTIRKRQANLDEVKACFSKLAKWHAVSYQLGLENDESVTGFKHDFFYNDELETKKFLTEGVDHFIEMLTTEEALRQFVPAFESMRRDLLSEHIGSCKEYIASRKSGQIYVLCHGDLHGKNVMFKRFVGRPAVEDVKMFDFQMCFFGPAMLDVIYSIFLLLDADLRLNHRDQIIEFYFENFIRALDLIGFEGRKPRFIDFQTQMREYKYSELYTLATFLPMVYAFVDGKTDVGEMVTSEEFRRRMAFHRDFIAEVKQLLPRYLEMGYLELKTK